MGYSDIEWLDNPWWTMINIGIIHWISHWTIYSNIIHWIIQNQKLDEPWYNHSILIVIDQNQFWSTLNDIINIWEWYHRPNPFPDVFPGGFGFWPKTDFGLWTLWTITVYDIISDNELINIQYGNEFMTEPRRLSRRMDQCAAADGPHNPRSVGYLMGTRYAGEVDWKCWHLLGFAYPFASWG